MPKIEKATAPAKAGVSHFHVGESDGRLTLLRALIDDDRINPAWLDPTLVGRSQQLLKEAIEVARRGSTVDIDTAARDAAKWVRAYFEGGGPPERLKSGKGNLRSGQDADVFAVNGADLEIVNVMARQAVVRDGSVAVRERFMEESDHQVSWHGDQARLTTQPRGRHERRKSR